MTDNRPGYGGVAHTRTTLWLGNSDSVSEWNGYGFKVTREDNMVRIEAALEDTHGPELEVFIMRDLFPKLRAVMDKIDKQYTADDEDDDKEESP